MGALPVGPLWSRGNCATNALLTRINLDGIWLMDRNDLISQLANRMNSNEMAAGMWLEATLDVLNGGVFKGGTPLAEAFQTAIPTSAYTGQKPEVLTKPLLRPATATARLSIDHEDIRMSTFPFRVGREARTHLMSKLPSFGERRNTKANPNNDLYIRDMGRPLNVSREHFHIERTEDGGYELVDRGSACGTIVSGCTIGGEYTGGRCALHDGDSIVVGTPESAFVFEFIVQDPQ